MKFFSYLRKHLNRKPPIDRSHSDWIPQQWNEETIRALFGNSADISIRVLFYGHNQWLKVIVIYCDGMADMKQIGEFVLPHLEIMLHNVSADQHLVLTKDPILQLNEINSGDDLLHQLFEGNMIVILEEQQQIFSVDVADIPGRSPEESNTEVSIKGPRDGFIEELSTNVALIRKRLKTTSLYNEQFRIGRRSQTKVSLLYIYDIIRPEIVEEVRLRLNKIDIDGLISTGQLEEALSDYSHSIFPLFDYIGRPDFAASSLLRGRFIIMIDGSPMAIIAPINLTAMLKSPEDIHAPFYFVALERLLRIVGLCISILAPGLWVALTSYDVDQLPFHLLATISNSRIGLPLSGPMEAFLMLGLFEIFREAGVRLPKAVGETIAVVGGLIVGDAAIRAGITSPTILFVAAVSAVATFTLVNQSLSGTVSVVRLFILICASFLGMYGFYLGVLAIIIYLSRLESFGLPYLAPISPFYWRDVISGLSVMPNDNNNKRAKMLQTIDSTSQREDPS